MCEYKVESYNIKDAQAEMNKLAKEGWRVVATAVTSNFNLIVTYERKKQ